jgi:AraC-like DNA-binding protein
MLTPEISTAEISLATGFADQSHFTRVFRKVTGITPAAFRVQLSRTAAKSRMSIKSAGRA